MKFVDSHCHLNYPGLCDDVDGAIQRAHTADVSTLLVVNTKLGAFPDILALTERYPHVIGSVGVHPHESVDADLSLLEESLFDGTLHKKIVGLGETGLDYHYMHSPKDIQHQAFALHLKVSEETGIPTIIHTREADADTVSMLHDFPKATGVFHCFSGSQDLARQALDLGFYISFSGIITFKNASDLRDVVSYVPWDRLLIETDSPYLAPIPHRGKTNEPAYARFVAEKIAEIRNKDLSEVAFQTTENFKRLFSKALPYVFENDPKDL